MTDEEALDAAIDAGTAALVKLCPRADRDELMPFGYYADNLAEMAVRAVWDLAVAHGREQAAQDVDYYLGTKGCHTWADYDALIRIARGGTP